MFSTEDVREMLQSFCPPNGGVGLLPSLILASNSQGLITLQHVRTEFEHHATTTKSRAPVSELAQDLDVDPGTILQLIQDQPHLALLSHENNLVIFKDERHQIHNNLRERLANGIIAKSEYALEKDISSKSLEHLLNDQKHELVHYDDHVHSEAYEKTVSEEALDIINRMINNITTGDYMARDFAEMTGSPPKWLVLYHLERLANSPEFTDKVSVRDLSNIIRIQAKQAAAYNINSCIQVVRLNNMAYFDVQNVVYHNPGLYDSVDDALNLCKSLPDIEVIGTFALLKKWFSDLLDSKLRALHYDEQGTVDVLEKFNERVQNTIAGHRPFPASLFPHVQRKTEQYLDHVIAQISHQQYHRFGTIIATDGYYNAARTALVDSAAEHAASQWNKLKSTPDLDPKFTFPDPTSLSSTTQAIHAALSKDKPTRKAAEEKFWSAISELETQNEAAFATYWSDRVVARTHIYAEGLASITDAKLHDQLQELLATYIQKDLVPDSISKARTQSLVLSRKTKKTLSKLESTLSTTPADVPALASALSAFNTKQSTPPPSPASLEAAKVSMVQDMRRRLSKPNLKASDGPVLFLTLITILHAQHFPGIVYATGKYAPKLLKQLKGKLGAGEYEKLEEWKELAKSGGLGEGEREGMRVLGGC
ncbi:hypothetical protein CC86DRAFT_361767 [Ophiobolus disseminans]|uniref:Uncharacterized protein n=1 Tax=Ophiobolus disseminans TaxID=1469910 RepID=A0A6A6ZGV4_9PLEO|nr:hypothetical protein CC86DRAFT_361767 [Ophiobolus disseminans]